MPTTLPLILFFIAGLIFGCWRSYRLLITSRRGTPPVEPLYRWLGMRLSAWKYEPHVSAAILVHTSSVALLAAAGVALAFKGATFEDTILADDPSMVGLVWFAEGGSLALTGYLLGALLAFPLASMEKKPVAYGVSEEGLVYGRSLMPWRWFSHFTIDQGKELLRFFSTFAPDMPSFFIQPPASVPMDELVELLERHLPQQPRGGTRRRHRTKDALVPIMALYCLSLVALGWVVTRLTRELGLFTIALCAGVLVAGGGQLISTYGFGTRGSGEKKSG